MAVWLTLTECSELTGVPTERIVELRGQGLIPWMIDRDGITLYDAECLETYKSTQKTEGGRAGAGDGQEPRGNVPAPRDHRISGNSLASLRREVTGWLAAAGKGGCVALSRASGVPASSISHITNGHYDSCSAKAAHDIRRAMRATSPAAVSGKAPDIIESFAAAVASSGMNMGDADVCCGWRPGTTSEIIRRKLQLKPDHMRGMDTFIASRSPASNVTDAVPLIQLPLPNGNAEPESAAAPELVTIRDATDELGVPDVWLRPYLRGREAESGQAILHPNPSNTHPNRLGIERKWLDANKATIRRDRERPSQEKIDAVNALPIQDPDANPETPAPNRRPGLWERLFGRRATA